VPYHFEFERQHRILRVVLVGRVDDAELLTAYRAIFSRQKALQPASGVVDFSLVTNFDVKGATIRRLAEDKPPFPPGVPRYLVTPADYMYGMARMFQILGEETRPGLHVARSNEEAYRGLGVENPSFQKLE
jgi:hypothetical protein